MKINDKKDEGITKEAPLITEHQRHWLLGSNRWRIVASDWSESFGVFNSGMISQAKIKPRSGLK